MAVQAAETVPGTGQADAVTAPSTTPAPAMMPRWQFRGLLGAYAALLRRFGRYRWFAWVGVRVLTPLDKWLYPRFHGRIVSAGPMVLPGLMLTATGRRSSQPRTSPLLYLEDGTDLVVFGSNFGQRHHPAWSHNLLADPRATVQIGERTRHVTARLATPQQRAKLWPRLLQVWPALQTYADRSGRHVRVFILSPRADEDALG